MKIMDTCSNGQLFLELAVLERSALKWSVMKVQERIILCTLTRLVVQSAQKSRHSFEYLERDETIIAHMVGGIDAYIKLSQGWPVSISPLKIYLSKSGISLSFLCKVESHANHYKRYIVPVLSIQIDFYVRVFVRVYMCKLTWTRRCEAHKRSCSIRDGE